VIWHISWSTKKLSGIKPFLKRTNFFCIFVHLVFWDSWYKFFLCTCVRRKYNKYLVNNFLLDQHNIFFAITIRYSLIANFDLGKIETAGFRTRSTRCSHAHCENSTKEGTVDFPGAKTRSHAPNVLKGQTCKVDGRTEGQARSK